MQICTCMGGSAIVHIKNKIRERCIRWFNYVHRLHVGTPIGMSDNLKVRGEKRGRGRQKLTQR